MISLSDIQKNPALPLGDAAADSPPHQPNLDAQALLDLAEQAEERAKSAVSAGEAAIAAARRAMEQESAAASEDEDKLKDARQVLLSQARAAAEAALQTQANARDAAAAAVFQAETDAHLLLKRQTEAQAELESLALLLEQAETNALYAQEAALEADKSAGEQALKAEAMEKSLEAAQLMAADAQKAYDKSLAVLERSRQEAVAATERLAQLQNQAAAIGASARDMREEAPEPSAARKRRGFWPVFWSYAKLLLIAFGLALLLRAYVFEVTQVKGTSMLPYLKNGDNLIASKISYIRNEPQRGDVVIIDAPDRSGEFYVKRIIGLPNEQITIQDGAVYIDGSLLNEPYLTQSHTEGEINLMVERDAYFLLGDNRSESHDSRDPAVGTIFEDTIRGKVVLRIYPWEDFGLLKGE